ncbi:MAG: phosphotransferase family protein [Gammaproteobacteria bacterium]
MRGPDPEIAGLAPILEKIAAAVRRRFGSAARIDNVEVATLGGSNRTLLFDLVEGHARRRLVSRQETYRLPNSPFTPPHVQFQLLEVARRHAVPVPEPVFEYIPEDELDRGYVVGFVAGETLPRRLLHDARFAGARARFADEAAEILARLHAIPGAEATSVADTPDSGDALGAQLARLDYYGEAHPAIELAGRWLRRHTRPPVRRCLVHGDFRTANFLMDEHGIRALLDWECAHLGDPLEDLGWLCMRGFRWGNLDLPVGGISARAPFYAAYARASGIEIDPEAVRWWEIFGMLRWAVINVMQAHGHCTGERRSPAFAACGRNVSMIEYDLLMTLLRHYD